MDKNKKSKWKFITVRTLKFQILQQGSAQDALAQHVRGRWVTQDYEAPAEG